MCTISWQSPIIKVEPIYDVPRSPSLKVSRQHSFSPQPIAPNPQKINLLFYKRKFSKEKLKKESYFRFSTHYSSLPTIFENIEIENSTC